MRSEREQQAVSSGRVAQLGRGSELERSKVASRVVAEKRGEWSVRSSAKPPLKLELGGAAVLGVVGYGATPVGRTRPRPASAGVVQHTS